MSVWVDGEYSRSYHRISKNLLIVDRVDNLGVVDKIFYLVSEQMSSQRHHRSPLTVCATIPRYLQTFIPLRISTFLCHNTHQETQCSPKQSFTSQRPSWLSQSERTLGVFAKYMCKFTLFVTMSGSFLFKGFLIRIRPMISGKISFLRNQNTNRLRDPLIVLLTFVLLYSTLFLVIRS